MLIIMHADGFEEKQQPEEESNYPDEILDAEWIPEIEQLKTIDEALRDRQDKTPLPPSMVNDAITKFLR